MNSPRLQDGLRDLEALFAMEHLPDGIMIPRSNRRKRSFGWLTS